VPEALEHAYRAFLQAQLAATAIDLADFPTGRFFDAFLDSLCLLPQITAISLPACDEPHWRAVARLLRANPHVRHFATAEAADDSFGALSEGIADRQATQIESLKFSCPELRSRHLRAISELYQAWPIPALTISVGLGAKSGAMFFKLMSSAQNLRSLTLDRLEGLSALDLVAHIDRLESLSLTRCGIDITQFLTVLERRRVVLRTLDLSGNLATRNVAKVFNFPPSLEKFIADDVMFRPSPFEWILRRLFALRKPLIASFKSNDLRAEQIDNVFRSVITRVPPPPTGYSLVELWWDNNYLTHGMVALLERCRQLQVLSLSGCQSQAEEAGKLLSAFLARNRCITELRVAGTMQHSISPLLVRAVIECLRVSNRSVAVVDLSHQELDADLIDALVQLLLDNRAIAALDFQDCRITDPAILDGFLRRLLPRGRPLRVALPSIDIEEMYRIGTIDDVAHKRLIGLVEALGKGDPAIFVPDETVQLPADAPGPPEFEELEVPQPEVMTAAPVKRTGVLADPMEWVTTVEPIPQPNDEEVLNAFYAENSIPALLAKLKGERTIA
jgi:hypothetical protein